MMVSRLIGLFIFGSLKTVSTTTRRCAACRDVWWPKARGWRVALRVSVTPPPSSADCKALKNR